MKTCIFAFYFALCCSTRALCQESLSEERVINETSKLLRWRAFWEGAQSLEHYKPGTRVEVAVISWGNETAVFMQEIRIAVYLVVARGTVVRRVITRMTQETNSAQADQYVQNQNGLPGFVLKSKAPPGTNGLPVRRPPINDPSHVSELRLIRFQLPALSVPDYIVSRTEPRDAEVLASAARSAVEGFYEPKCNGGLLKIPYFSDDDPIVFVYVDLGPGCEKGVLPFVRHEVRWIPGQFSPARAPNDWSYTIRRIHEYKLVEVRFP